MAVEYNAGLAGQIRLGDLNINRLGYGAMRITGEGIWGEPKNHQEAVDLLKSAVSYGINFIDTADAYGPEVSEKLIAEALYPYDGLVIATKGGLTRSGPGQWTPDCSPEHLIEACDASLRRLKIDQIDLYQLHTVDPKVPFEESFKTLLELQQRGKIKHIGLSNIRPEQFSKAVNLGSFVSVQNNYNVFNREHEDVLRLCEQHSLAFIPYFPVGGNRQGGPVDEVVEAIALKHQATVHQIALAWLIKHSPNIVPIPGTSSINHLQENIASVNIELDEEDVSRLDSISNNVS
jgi:aryl-alcohol dehydrogenase-like predicted oxidoreductase